MVVEMINRLPKISQSTPESAAEPTAESAAESTPEPAAEPAANLLPSSLSNLLGLEVAISSPVAFYSIYMDNYFNLVALFNHLYNHQYGACGIARPISGLPPLFQELREHAKGLPWGTLYALLILNILCLA
jgi:hypothetical protein